MASVVRTWLSRVVAAGFAVGVILTGFSSCDNRRLDSGISAEQAFPATYSALRARIFEPRCSRCHAMIVSHKGIMEFVVAGDAAQSPLYTETNSKGMPENGAKLMDAELAAIKKWINDGARND